MTDLFDALDALDATWPAAGYQALGPFTLRDGAGGGKRVSATTCGAAFTQDQLDAAIAAMRARGQHPLFQVRSDQQTLDDALQARGFGVVDPVVILQAPTATVAADGPPLVTAFAAWPPLARQREIWAAGGVGPDRLAIMDRVKTPKTSFLGRVADSPGGAAFVACHGTTAMAHAVAVLPEAQRKGCARNMMQAAAQWALAQGAQTFAVLTVRDNLPARALYSSLGLTPVGHYHYRMLT